MKVFYLLFSLLFLACSNQHDKNQVTVRLPINQPDTNQEKSFQPPTINPDKDGYYRKTDKTPELVGSFEQLKKNVIYPEYEKNLRIQGRIVTQVSINEKGHIDKIEILMGIDSALDKAAIDGIKTAKFIPAYIDGKPVKVKLVIPIEFKLNDYNSGDSYVNGPHPFLNYLEDVDKKAEPIGGMDAIAKLIAYPLFAAQKGIESKVVMKAYIDEFGNVKRAVPDISTLNERGTRYFFIAAENAIKKVKFIPAEKDGKKVKSKITIPVEFKLN